MTIDIYSKGDYPSNVLSNFYPNAFEIDGVKCASMEGFLQSLKFKSPKKQIEICKLCGKAAKNKGKRKFLWKLTGNVYWQGKRYKRNGAEFAALITRAYGCLFENETFYNALKAAENARLTHTAGRENPKKTILTTDEFLSRINELVSKLR